MKTGLLKWGGLVLWLCAGGAVADDYWWASPPTGRAGNGVWDLATANWTDVGTTTGSETFFAWRSNQRVRFESGSDVVLLGDNITFTGNGYLTIRSGSLAIYSVLAGGDALYGLAFDIGSLRAIDVQYSGAQFNVPVSGKVHIASIRDRNVTFNGPIVGETTTLAMVITGVIASGDGAFVRLSGVNTYGGATLIEGRLSAEVTNEYSLALSGSLAHANITLVNGGVLRGFDTANQGTLNFNINGDTADSIVIGTAGRLELDNLHLKVNLSGTQTPGEFVVADYSAGGTVTGTAFASVTGLPPGWAIVYEGTDTHPNAIVLVYIPGTNYPILILGAGLLLLCPGRRRRRAFLGGALKSLAVGLTVLCLAGAVFAEDPPPEPVEIDMEGGALFNLGLVPLSATNLVMDAPFHGMSVSVGQLAGIHPEDGSPITNYYLLLPLVARSVHAAGLVNAGGFVGDGSLLSNLDAGAIATGRLPVGALPTSGTWDASGLTLQNVGLAGDVRVDGQALSIATNLTVQGVITGDGSGLSRVAAAGEAGAVQYNLDGQLGGLADMYIHEETGKPAIRGLGGELLRMYLNGTVSDAQLVFVLRQQDNTAELVLRRNGEDTIRLRGDGSIQATGALSVGSLSVGEGNGQTWFIPEQGDLSMGPFTQQ